jgi:hypothetical protein
MFTPHPNLADDVNHAIIQSEIEGGVFLHDLPPSTVLHIQTMHHCYTAVLLGGSDALISGHPEFCPDPVQVAIAGSTWGGSMLKLQYVGRGMHLEFRHPEIAPHKKGWQLCHKPVIPSAISAFVSRMIFEVEGPAAYPRHHGLCVAGIRFAIVAFHSNFPPIDLRSLTLYHSPEPPCMAGNWKT